MKSNLKFPDNVTLKFDSKGIIMRVGLNISEDLVPYMTQGNVHKGKVYWVYSRETRISKYVLSKKKLENVKKGMLLKIMADIREAKSKKHAMDSIKCKSLIPKQLKIW